MPSILARKIPARSTGAIRVEDAAVIGECSEVGGHLTGRGWHRPHVLTLDANVPRPLWQTPHALPALIWSIVIGGASSTFIGKSAG